MASSIPRSRASDQLDSTVPSISVMQIFSLFRDSLHQLKYIKCLCVIRTGVQLHVYTCMCLLFILCSTTAQEEYQLCRGDHSGCISNPCQWLKGPCAFSPTADTSGWSVFVKHVVHFYCGAVLKLGHISCMVCYSEIFALSSIFN